MPAIGQRDFNPVRAVDDVAVGEGEPVGREDESRPAAVPQCGTIALVTTLMHVNLYHRRADRLRRVDHGIGIRVKQRPVLSILRSPDLFGTEGGHSGIAKDGAVRHWLTVDCGLSIQRCRLICHRQHANILFCDSHVTTPPFPAIGNK